MGPPLDGWIRSTGRHPTALIKLVFFFWKEGKKFALYIDREGGLNWSCPCSALRTTTVKTVPDSPVRYPLRFDDDGSSCRTPRPNKTACKNVPSKCEKLQQQQEEEKKTPAESSTWRVFRRFANPAHLQAAASSSVPVSMSTAGSFTITPILRFLTSTILFFLYKMYSLHIKSLRHISFFVFLKV